MCTLSLSIVCRGTLYWLGGWDDPGKRVWRVQCKNLLNLRLYQCQACLKDDESVDGVYAYIVADCLSTNPQSAVDH